MESILVILLQVFFFQIVQGLETVELRINHSIKIMETFHWFSGFFNDIEKILLIVDSQVAIALEDSDKNFSFFFLYILLNILQKSKLFLD